MNNSEIMAAYIEMMADITSDEEREAFKAMVRTDTDLTHHDRTALFAGLTTTATE